MSFFLTAASSLRKQTAKAWITTWKFPRTASHQASPGTRRKSRCWTPWRCCGCCSSDLEGVWENKFANDDLIECWKNNGMLASKAEPLSMHFFGGEQWWLVGWTAPFPPCLSLHTYNFKSQGCLNLIQFDWKYYCGKQLLKYSPFPSHCIV